VVKDVCHSLLAVRCRFLFKLPSGQAPTLPFIRQSFAIHYLPLAIRHSPSFSARREPRPPITHYALRITLTPFPSVSWHNCDEPNGSARCRVRGEKMTVMSCELRVAGCELGVMRNFVLPKFFGRRDSPLTGLLQTAMMLVGVASAANKFEWQIW